LGAILRKYKLDELPELWNVLKGDMSFVSPLSREIFILFQRGRPDFPGYADKLTGTVCLVLTLLSVNIFLPLLKI
jgi:hypothetical protein